MKNSKPLILLVAALVFIGTAAFFHAVFANTVYLPVVMQPKWTPSRTPLPTPKPSITPTRTPVPRYNLSIVKIVNLNTMNPLDEYVVISNNTSVAVNLTDWFIKDDGPNRYDFPEDYYIPSKETIKVWTKAGIDGTYNLFWGSAVEVWNDGGDCAYLRDDSTGEKILVDKYCYTTGDDGLTILILEP